MTTFSMDLILSYKHISSKHKNPYVELSTYGFLNVNIIYFYNIQS